MEREGGGVRGDMLMQGLRFHFYDIIGVLASRVHALCRQDTGITRSFTHPARSSLGVRVSVCNPPDFLCLSREHVGVTKDIFLCDSVCSFLYG